MIPFILFQVVIGLVTIATVGVRTAIFNSLSESVCAGQLYALPSGMVVATAGTYNDTLRYTAGCDSVITTVNLTLKQPGALY